MNDNDEDMVRSGLMKWSMDYNEQPLPMGVLDAMEGDSDEDLARLITHGYAQEIPNGGQVTTRSVGIITKKEGNNRWVDERQINTPVLHYEITPKGIEKIKEIRGIMYDMIMQWFTTHGERSIVMPQLLYMFPFNSKLANGKGLYVPLLHEDKLINSMDSEYKLTPKALEIIKGKR